MTTFNSTILPHNTANCNADEAGYRSFVSSLLLFEGVTPSIFAGITIMTYDLFETIEEDIALLAEHRFSLPSIAYWLTRLSTYSFLISDIVFANNEGEFERMLIVAHVRMVCLILHRGSTTLLPYLRVHALYPSNRYVHAFFGLYFLGICVASALSFFRPFIHPWGLSFSLEYASTWYGVDSCGRPEPEWIAINLSSYQYGLPWVPLMLAGFDLCGLLAIIYKLSANFVPMVEDGRRNSGVTWITSWTSSKNVRKLPTRFFHDSFVYFTVTAFIKILQAALIYSFNGAKWMNPGDGSPGGLSFAAPSIQVHRVLFTSIVVDTAVACVLSCKIYRCMRLGLPGIMPNDETTCRSKPLATLNFVKTCSTTDKV